MNHHRPETLNPEPQNQTVRVFCLVLPDLIRYAACMEMQWEIARPAAEVVRDIQNHLHCHVVTATVLANRGITTADKADDFINSRLTSLPSPMTLDGMVIAVQRIHLALMRNERIMVFGDYDADGITATVLLATFLNMLGAKVYRHLPHRIQEGYGLQPAHIAQVAAAQGISLIITVDCGSSSFEAVAAAKRYGIDVIITDHHNIGPSVPEALAVINPKCEGQPAVFRNLAGVGVAFYLAIGLRSYLRDSGWWADGHAPNLKDLCDLVAVGTVADMVPLTGINRILTRSGLEVLNLRPRPGLQALIAACSIRRFPVTADDIAFRLAPRINAAGRMAHAVLAYNLLSAASLSQAGELAQTLNELNQRRQNIENQILQHIVARLESRQEWLSSNSLVLAGEEWHEGVLGIVAAKLVGLYHRPVVVIATQDGKARGSARSIPEVDLYAALNQCQDLLDQYGGHRMAAGLSLPSRNITRLKHAFEQVVSRMTGGRPIIPNLNIDCEIEFDDICADLINELDDLAPFGADNPTPVFMARRIHVTSAAIVGQCHRRMILQQPHQQSTPLTAIHFNLPPNAARAAFFDRLAFGMQWNHYKGNQQIQLVVKGIESF